MRATRRAVASAALVASAPLLAFPSASAQGPSDESRGTQYFYADRHCEIDGIHYHLHVEWRDFGNTVEPTAVRINMDGYGFDYTIKYRPGDGTPWFTRSGDSPSQHVNFLNIVDQVSTHPESTEPNVQAWMGPRNASPECFRKVNLF